MASIRYSTTVVFDSRRLHQFVMLWLGMKAMHHISFKEAVLLSIPLVCMLVWQSEQ
jgi:hypothetical protein